MICQGATTEHKIIQSENLAIGCSAHKKCHHFKNIYFPNALPREIRRSNILNLMIKRPSVKLPTSIKAPTKTVTSTTPRNLRLDQVKKEKEVANSQSLNFL
ncbi:hypothetical protein ACB094_09G029200 [Castanea mollissima]